MTPTRTRDRSALGGADYSANQTLELADKLVAGNSMKTGSARWKPGDAERAYDLCVLLGLNPVPWQFDLLQRIEQRDVDETFHEIVKA